MSASLFRGRVGATVGLHALGMAFAWALAAVLTLPVLSPLARHPEGYFALFAEGGRVGADVWRAQSSAAAVSLGAAALALGAWAAAWVVLGGVLPALGAVEPAPSLHRAASYSLRRASTLVGLALVALTGYGLAGAACWLGSGRLLVAIGRGEPPPVVAPRELVGLAAGALVAALVTAWHDVARVVAVGRGAGTLGATAGALAWISREPVATLGAAAAHAAAGALGVLVAYGAGFVWGASGARGALVALTLTQQAALAWRAGWRARWFFHLGARFRARTQASEPTAEQGP